MQLHPIVRGLIKIVLAMPIFYILSAVDWGFLSNVTIGNNTADLSMIGPIIVAFAPLMLILSGLRDMGVRM